MQLGDEELRQAFEKFGELEEGNFIMREPLSGASRCVNKNVARIVYVYCSSDGWICICFIVCVCVCVVGLRCAFEDLK